MSFFLERFVLVILAGSVITVLLLNPLKLDWRQRASLLVCVVSLAYFVGRTLEKQKSTLVSPTVPVLQNPAQASGDATTSGDQSPAVTGKDNTFTYDSTPATKPKTTAAPKGKR